MMDAQEIFDAVATHLLTQKERSVEGEREYGCAYRGANGLKCAVGCLIRDDEYDPLFEGKDVDMLLRHNPVLFKDLLPFTDLLTELQQLHDTREVSNWKGELAELAHIYELDAGVLNVVSIQ